LIKTVNNKDSIEIA